MRQRPQSFPLADQNLATTLLKIKRGIEKENLRVRLNGDLSLSAHPQLLGHPLTHPYLTTDFSEALLELIVPPFESLHGLFDFLEKMHIEIYHKLNSEREILWVNSMPCPLPEEKDIPIAIYGKSATGKIKHIYRKGLAVRYGKSMQTIAGIHYNFSLPKEFWEILIEREGFKGEFKDFVSQKYFHMIRNFIRLSWPMVYLFGASPAVDESFLRGKSHPLTKIKGSHQTYYGPHATSLRMSDLGYHNKAQSDLHISFNSFPQYREGIIKALETSYPAYEKIGVRDAAGEYQQLNTNLLQIENEFYGTIRPKRIVEQGERTTLALARRGVEYVEVRSIDLNPFLPFGICREQSQWIEMFLLYCLLEKSPLLTEEEQNAAGANHKWVALEGRNPDLKLQKGKKQIALKDWALEICEGLFPYAEVFDQVFSQEQKGEFYPYKEVLETQIRKIHHPEETPSAKILKILLDTQISLMDLTLEQSLQHQKHFTRKTQDPEQESYFKKLREQSFHQVQELEQRQATINLEEYLKHYLSNRQ